MVGGVSKSSLSLSVFRCWSLSVLCSFFALFLTISSRPKEKGVQLRSRRRCFVDFFFPKSSKFRN